jgi:hypothetical protein
VIEAHDLLAAVDARTPMVIGDGTTEEDEVASRATLGWMNNSSVGVQRYQGVPPWEIHRDADELLYVMDGDMELTVIGDDGPEVVADRRHGCHRSEEPMASSGRQDDGHVVQLHSLHRLRRRLQ